MNRFDGSIQQFLSCFTIFNVNSCIFVDKCQCIFVWWSSATLGEGTRMTGLPSRQNSEIEPAPARLITTSAAL